jgi:NAD(P)-dependent dehydrogenase (short-subunit alcohol dehydrogenase family)
MLISEGNLPRGILKGETVVITGADRGIGYETARALVWLGANVVVAEINETDGRAAVENLEKEFGAGRALFVKTDVGSDEDIKKLEKEANGKFGKVDVIINNARVLPIGAVKDTSIDKWDESYRVNLRGPVVLARTFLQDMMKRKHGVFVCVSSSGAAPYVGAYQVFKTAQVELAHTIAAEVKETGVYAFAIAPGVVRTPGFAEGGGQVAAYMGKTLDQLLEMNKDFEITPEAAGAGFAAAVALAPKYHGQETSAVQALMAIGIGLGREEEAKPATASNATETQRRLERFHPVLKTFTEQSEGWNSRNFFQRQWILRDFRKNTGMSVDEMQNKLETIRDRIEMGASPSRSIETLNKLHDYYTHQQELLKGFEKIQKKQAENLEIIEGWKSDIKALIETLTSEATPSR